MYTVKSGDTLGKIAKTHETSIKAIRALNSSVATTDRIRVGDKLRLPAKSSGAARPPRFAPVDSTGASTAATNAGQQSASLGGTIEQGFLTGRRETSPGRPVNRNEN